MLTRFSVQGLSLIRDATLRLGPGLNVLTGEPGSGKSLLLTGLGLLLGGRAKPELVREGVAEAEVTAELELDDAAAALLPSELGIGPGRLLVSRTLPRSGRARAELGGRAVSIAGLADSMRFLLTLTAQHAGSALGDPKALFSALDADDGGLSLAVTEAVREVSKARTALEREQVLALRADREGELLRRDLGELRGMDPEALDATRLAARLATLRASERIAACSARLADVLVEREGAVEQELRALLGQLERLPGVDLLAPARESLEEALAAVHQAALTAERAQRDLFADPGELERLEEQERALARLCRRHGCGQSELPAKVAALEAELALLEGAAVRREQERTRLEAAVESAVALARELHARRKLRAVELEGRLEAELAALGMRGARLIFELVERSPDALDSRGLSDLRVLFAPNVGERPGELSRIASGGERARVLLGLRCAGVAASAPTLVLDEVDAGLGGAALEAVASRLSRAARGRQILCVTHHAGVAACADFHFRVQKFVSAGRTEVEVERLGGERRVAELARMLAGGNERGAKPLARRLLEGKRAGREDAA
jgi:DNA repair protein RecN (Recombination protein N)